MSENHFYKIALVGAGSVAIHLGLALKHAGFKIEYVINRSPERGMLLAKKLDALYVSGFEAFFNPDLIIVAVSDDAIPVIAKQLSGSSIPVVHTSGTVSKDVLSHTGSDYGVFYPLQTFSVSNAVDFSKVPICIDSSNSLFTIRLENLAHSLSNTVCLIDDQKRRILHLAGVFASNFSNYLYAIAEDILSKNDIPFELLLPLIQETAHKIQTIAPLEAQTGPAKRGDMTTIQKHLMLLQNEPELLDLYKIFTDNILKTYSHQISTSDINLNEDK
jgi:predicted short-subunit dehydrogenase-like oxidoreductase (DUF2520 family)